MDSFDRKLTMGTSVCSYHIRNVTQARCLDALAKVKSPHAYVSDALNGWVTILDEDADAFRQEPLDHRVAKVSKLLKADAIITVVFDDDITQYVAFHNGVVVDRYSTPSDSFELFPWLSDKKFPGNPTRIAQAFSWWKGQSELESILKKKYKMESMRLKDVAVAFSISEYRTSVTINDLRNPIPTARVAGIPADSEFGKLLRAKQGFIEFTG
jgi:hypothetical protein